MFIPSLRIGWSFCKCTNACFFPLLSLLTGFNKLICVRMYTPSPVSPTVQTPSSLTQFLSYHRSEKTCLSTALCVPLPLNPAPNLGPDPQHPRPPRTGGIWCPPPAGAFRYRVAALWSSVAEPASVDYLFSYCIYISCCVLN